jgi:basic membrane protein A
MISSRVYKYIVLLILLAITAGCAQPAATTQAPEPTKASEKTQAPAVSEPALIAFAYVGPVSDMGWTYTHDEARKAMEAAFPGQVKTAFIENMPYSEEASRALEQFVADGAKMIFINSEYADFVTAVADNHPDVFFLECDGHRVSKNEVWYYVAHWNPTYLIGMAAGLMTQTNTLGYIGSYPVQSVYASVNSFQLGARSVNPEVETKVVLINSWFDPAKANQAANALIDDGADFIMDIMDETAALQVEEKRGVWGATWNTDQRAAAPTKYVSSVSLNWNDYYISEVQSFLDGTWTGDRYTLLEMGNGVDRDKWGPNVPADVQSQVDAVRETIMNGSFNPFVGPIKDTKGEVRVPEGQTMTEMDLYLWDWAVEGVSGLPD